MSSGPKDARVSLPWARFTTKSQGGRPFSAQHTNAVRRPDSAARASELGTVKGRTPKRTLPVSGPVAQLDRAPDYESGGQRFESVRARHSPAKSRFNVWLQKVHLQSLLTLAEAGTILLFSDTASACVSSAILRRETFGSDIRCKRNRVRCDPHRGSDHADDQAAMARACARGSRIEPSLATLAFPLEKIPKRPDGVFQL